MSTDRNTTGADASSSAPATPVNPAEVIAEHGLLHWHAITGSHAPRVRAVCLCGYEASEDIVSSNLAGRQARRMLAPHQVSKLSEHGYSIVREYEPSVEGLLYDEAVSLGYWLAKQLGEHVDRQSDLGETLTDTVKRLLAAAAAAEEDQ